MSKIYFIVVSCWKEIKSNFPSDDSAVKWDKSKTGDHSCFSRKALDFFAKTFPKTSRGKGSHISRLPLSTFSRTIPQLFDAGPHFFNFLLFSPSSSASSAPASLSWSGLVEASGIGKVANLKETFKTCLNLILNEVIVTWYSSGSIT